MTDQLKEYEVTGARFIEGQYRDIFEFVKMSERSAKYYVEPHGNGLKLSAAQIAKDARAEKDAQAAADQVESDAQVVAVKKSSAIGKSTVPVKEAESASDTKI